MNNPLRNVSRMKLAAFLAVATVPVTLFAVTYSELIVTYEASIGSNTFGQSGNSGLLLVGFANNHGSYHSNALAVGSYNIIRNSNSAVIGQWNKSTGTGMELFVLANGNGIENDPDKERNVMEVFKNGAIRIMPQGDILMGDYQ